MSPRACEKLLDRALQNFRSYRCTWPVFARPLHQAQPSPGRPSGICGELWILTCCGWPGKGNSHDSVPHQPLQCPYLPKHARVFAAPCSSATLSAVAFKTPHSLIEVVGESLVSWCRHTTVCWPVGTRFSKCFAATFSTARETPRFGGFWQPKGFRWSGLVFPFLSYNQVCRGPSQLQVQNGAILLSCSLFHVLRDSFTSIERQIMRYRSLAFNCFIIDVNERQISTATSYKRTKNRGEPKILHRKPLMDFRGRVDVSISR